MILIEIIISLFVTDTTSNARMAPCGRGSLALRALRRQLFSPIRVDIGTIDIRICNPLIALTTVLAYFRPNALLALRAPTTVLAD